MGIPIVPQDFSREFSMYWKKTRLRLKKRRKMNKINKAIRRLITSDTNMTGDPKKVHKFVVQLDAIN